jgi:hypothetical protein
MSKSFPHTLKDRAARVDVVTDMMGQLWTAQLDRHGTNDETAPLAVSQAQAEAAVHLAVTLVHWFQSGAVRPV